METHSKVSLWLGTFTSETAFYEFLHETFDNEGDVTSKFMEAFQIAYIDPNFQEIDFYENKNDKENVFDGFSYIDSFINKIPSLNWQEYNSIILIYNFEYQGIIKETKELKFIATFDYIED